jgi:predicted nucleotidyltransferase
MAVKVAAGLEISTERLAELCRRYCVREMAVFGSAARGELRPDSDIDILVDFLPEADLGWEFFRLEEELSQLFGRRVDLGTKRSLKPWVRANALRDARVIYAA